MKYCLQCQTLERPFPTFHFIQQKVWVFHPPCSCFVLFGYLSFDWCPFSRGKKTPISFPFFYYYVVTANLVSTRYYKSRCPFIPQGDIYPLAVFYLIREPISVLLAMAWRWELYILHSSSCWEYAMSIFYNLFKFIVRFSVINCCEAQQSENFSFICAQEQKCSKLVHLGLECWPWTQVGILLLDEKQIYI
jgi:hypothetical protein